MEVTVNLAPERQAENWVAEAFVNIEYEQELSELFVDREGDFIYIEITTVSSAEWSSEKWVQLKYERRIWKLEGTPVLTDQGPVDMVVWATDQESW